MKKLIGGILALLTLVFLFPSCDDTESYADKLKKEKKNISNFLTENKIDLIYEYPEDGEFKDNQFFYDKSAGIYIQVVDTGNGKRASNSGVLSVVNVRYSETRELPDTTKYSNSGAGGGAPLEFIYGLPATYTESTTSSGYYFKSASLAYPLQYVGEEGIVRLLIPFSQGSYYQQNTSYGPVYMGHVKYTSIK